MKFKTKSVEILFVFISPPPLLTVMSAEVIIKIVLNIRLQRRGQENEELKVSSQTPAAGVKHCI